MLLMMRGGVKGEAQIRAEEGDSVWSEICVGVCVCVHMCEFRGDTCPTLGERGSDLSSYNISASSDPRSGLVGASEG